MHTGKGFIAALDQSGGSTPKALAYYGVEKDAYSTDEEMFALVHEMRSRIIKSPAFTSEHVLAAILFENTMDGEIDGIPVADYLWEKKGIVPFLKIDKGLTDLKDGVQLLKPIPDLDSLLKRAATKHIFGTKERSVIKEANEDGIRQIVDQQFDLALKVIKAGLVPIIEPEVDIHSTTKKEAEDILKKHLAAWLGKLDATTQVIFKLTIPTVDDFYSDLMEDPHVLRIVALSGGYSREEANERLSKNHGLIASFSRALAEGLNVHQTDAQFDKFLGASVQSIYHASIT